MQHEVLLQPIAADDNQPWLTDACGVTPDTCGVSLDIGGVALDTCAVALDTCAVALDTYGVDLMPPVVWPETVAYCPCLHQLQVTMLHKLRLVQHTFLFTVQVSHRFQHSSAL